jgi:hypothetical protein
MKNLAVALKAMALGALFAAGTFFWVGANLVRSVVAVLRLV